VRPILLAATVVVALLPAASPAVAAPLNIVAAENFYGDLATEIGGTLVTVTSILSSPDQDPHLFETSPSTAVAISGADIVIYNGADYDPWMDKLLTASPRPARTALVAAGLVGHKSGDNPHLWYDPKTLPALATALEAELAKRDPSDAATYKANLEAFIASFAPVTDAIAKIKAAHPGISVTATEPVFGYMAAALGFNMLNPEFQLAMMNDTEPSPSQVARFEQSLKTKVAKILFYNAQVTDDTTTRLLKLANDDGVPVIGVTETEPAGMTIATWFAGQLAEVERALK
jgi:zinc/manganese transport system substrate-binding protein